MSEILQIITPKWEEEELVWARKNKSTEGGGGYFYASIRTSTTVIGNYRGKSANDPITAPLTDELNAAALFMLSNIFVYERNTAAWMDTTKDMRQNLFVDAEQDWTVWTKFEGEMPPAQNDESGVGNDKYQIPEDTDPCDIPDSSKQVAIKTVTVGDQVQAFLGKMIIEDKNIAFPSCFKSAILLKISFADIIRLLTAGTADYPSFEKSEIRPELESVLGLLKPKPPVEDNCCDCVEDPTTPPPEKKVPPKPLNSPPPGWATKTYEWCCGPFRGEGVPPVQKLFSGCTWMPKLKENEYLTQAEKDKEDELFRLGCHIRTCAQTETKGKIDFVGSEIGPPSFEKPGPCGDIDSIETMQQALDYIITPFGIEGLIKKAAKCVGMDLSLEDLKEMIIMAAIENLDCNQIIKLINKVEQLTGVDIRSTPKVIGYFAKVVGPIIDKLPAKEIRKIAKHLNLDPKFVGAIDTKDISACAVISAKMPQEIKEIAAHLGGLPAEQLVGFLFDFNLAEQTLLSVCEKYKKEIVAELRIVLDSVNLDDLSSPGDININLELPNLIGSLGNIDFGWLDSAFGSLSTDNLGSESAPINWGALFPNGGFNISAPNIGTINWSALGDIDFNKFGIVFEALGKIDLSKVSEIDFGTDINFDFLVNINFPEISEAFKTLGAINFKTPVFDPTVLLNISFPDIDFGQLGDIFKIFGNINFSDIMESLGGVVGNIADKFEKIAKDALNLDLSNVAADFLNDQQINPPNKLPKLPTIDLPDLLPTTDFMASFANGIAEGITSALSQAMISMIKSVLGAVCQACDQGNIGDLDIGATIAESAKSFDPNKVKHAQENVIGELKKLTPTKISTSEAAETLDSLISDVSEILKPGEIANLLLGKATPDVTEAIECLVQQKPGYVAIAPAIDGNGQINKLFANIGELADKELLLAQVSELTKPKKRNSDQPFLPGCETDQEELDREALVNLGIAPEEVEKQLENARKRKKKKFKELADLLAKPNVLDGVVPEPECNISAADENKPGVVSEEPPSLKAMQKMTINTLYDGVYISFNRDIARFPEAVGVTKEITKSIPRTLTSITDEGDSVAYLNPELRRLASDGVIIPDFEIGDTDNADDQEEEPNIKTKVPSLQIAPGLKGFLSDFEDNHELFVAGTGMYQLIVPNKTGIEKAQQNFEFLKDPKKAENFPDIIGIQNDLNQALIESKFKINYFLEDARELDKENYTIRIESYVSSSKEGEVTGSLFSASTEPAGSILSQGIIDVLEHGPAIYRGRRSDTVYGSNLHNGQVHDPIRDFLWFLQVSYERGSGQPNFPSEMTAVQHDDIFNDIIANISKQCAKSDFFDPKILKMVEFTPQLTERQKACGCKDPHLLDLEEIKKKVMEEYEEERCDDDSFPNEDPSGGATVGPLESAAIAGVLQTVIRLYLIDFTIRAIFVLSEFGVSEPETFNTFLDSLIETYYTNSIIDDLVKRDKAYAVEFQRQAILYHNKIAAKHNWTKTQDAGKAIGDLVSLQLGSVTTRLTQILGKNWGNYSINQVLAENWLPLFDLPGTVAAGNDVELESKVNRFGQKGISFAESPGAQFKTVTDVKSMMDTYIPQLDFGNTLVAVGNSIQNLEALLSKPAQSGIALSGSTVFRGDKFDSSNPDSIQRLYFTPALVNLGKFTGWDNSQIWVLGLDNQRGWNQWPLMNGAAGYSAASGLWRTATWYSSNMQDLNFRQVQEINQNKREIYHFKDWRTNATYTSQHTMTEEHFRFTNSMQTRDWALENDSTIPSYWNQPYDRGDSTFTPATISSNAFPSLSMMDLVTSFENEINYYKAHMVRSFGIGQGVADLWGQTDEIEPDQINNQAALFDIAYNARPEAIIAMLAPGDVAVYDGVSLPANHFIIYRWAKEQYLLKTENMSPVLRSYFEGRLFNQAATELLFPQGVGSIYEIDAAHKFAWNFLQQQLRFAARIRSYQMQLGVGADGTFFDVWSSPDGNGVFKGVEEYHEDTEETHYHGLLELASRELREQFNKRVSEYGGPPGGLSMLKNLQKNVTVEGEETTFKLANGNLILERYITKSRAMDQMLGIGRNENGQSVNWDASKNWKKGKVSLDVFINMMQAKIGNMQTNERIPDAWRDAKIGLRLTYVPPVDPRGFDDPPTALRPETSKIISEKAYNLIEEIIVPEEFAMGNLAGDVTAQAEVKDPQTLEVSTGRTIKAERKVYPIPLVEVELDFIPPGIGTVGELLRSNALNKERLWAEKNGALMTALINKPDFKFLFEYCFPLKRMLFLVMLYNMVYFSFDKDVLNLFNNTKEALKQTFYTVLNAGDYTYGDKTMQKVGGNKGLMTAMENGDDIPGVDLAGIIARTPLLILKGLAEQTDPNIGIAKKIHDGALAGGKDLPMVVCSILGLPMNVIPPPPIGPGIGPPIGPLGFAYLALDAGSALLSSEEKKLKKKNLLENKDLNLDDAKNNSGCAEP